MNVNTAEIVQTILTGNISPEDLRVISSALNERIKSDRNKVRAINRFTLKPTDRVTLKNIRPKHYIGRTGTIRAIARTTCKVQLDGTTSSLNVPLSCVELVS